MKQMRLQWIRTVLIAVCLAGVASATALAKSYGIESLLVEVTVGPDGGLQVEERIRYRFTGAYSFAFREILIKPGESLGEIRVSEDGQVYAESDQESPGAYSVVRQVDRVKVTWHFKARDESRTFIVRYRVGGVVLRHSDTAELNYQFVGDDWDRPIGQVRATVRFPSSVSPDSVRAWAHGPLHGTVHLADDGSVRFAVAPLPARTYWEGRLLFPAAIVPGVEPHSAGPALDRILEEERAWAEEANRLREEAAAAEMGRGQLAASLAPWCVLAAVAGAGLWVFLFLRHGKPHPRQRTFPPGEPPGSLKPAVADYLLNRTLGGSAIAATFVDLARRGFLEIEETERKKSSWFGEKKSSDYRLATTGKPLSEAADYERDLVQFAIAEAGKGEGVWLSDFKKVAGRSASRFHKWFKQWKEQVEELGRRFFEPFSKTALLVNLLAALAILGFGILASVASKSAVGLPAIVVGAMQAIASLALGRRTPEGQDLYRGWKEFRAHLKSISKGLGPISLGSQDWGRYLVASIILGLHRDLSKKLDVARDPEAAQAVAWYVPLHGNSSAGLSDFGSSISAMVSSVGSTASSAVGAGGGASVGGGAGSGGGGGGAG